MAGINRAQYENRQLAKAKALLRKPCIFLSHISVDKKAATAIGDYITRHGDIDIYLDINDQKLQEAIRRGDPTGITQFIEQGLAYSTHIMCLVSADTVSSWWVPYELGFGKSSGKYLSTLKFKGDVDLPAYLQISEVLWGTKSLNQYLKDVGRGFQKATEIEHLTESLITHTTQRHPLDEYLDWKV
ncbi:MAG: toll/interleukin-1 receptor domain-containing protein [Nitrospira sp. BO4]|jgi:hypothetical protein|nr:toll/interleukin-1 receptor domain-containing protein [Nitrospira sp. BO4]